jgi:hypothetical protein
MKIKQASLIKASNPGVKKATQNITFVPLFLGRPNDANQSPPRRQIVCKIIHQNIYEMLIKNATIRVKIFQRLHNNKSADCILIFKISSNYQHI